MERDNGAETTRTIFQEEERQKRQERKEGKERKERKEKEEITNKPLTLHLECVFVHVHDITLHTTSNNYYEKVLEHIIIIIG